ncbi:MAG: hypothetical protein ACI8UO_001534 [Verrucomicrobiales bacterium]|jgi:hypothetical protein
MKFSALNLALFFGLLIPAFGEDLPLPAPDFFANQVWPRVGAKTCLKCHKSGGDAEETKFILQDPARDSSEKKAESLSHNRAAFLKIAKLREEGEDEWLALLKVTDEIDHEGGDVLSRGSAEFRIFERFVRVANGEPAPAAAGIEPAYEQGPFWDGIAMLENRKLLRRLTLSLAGRLPSQTELKAIESGGLEALGTVLDSVMTEEPFYERLSEAFNDIFLTRGYDGVPERALSYEHFSTTRGWAQKYDLTHVGDEKAQQKARYKLYDDYREAMLREPLELINHIVRNDRSFTEIVTADYIMVSPFTSRGYGIFEELEERFEDPEDPLEFVSVQLKALVSRDKRSDMESPTGFYPHAGLLSTFQYLKRYPTTETNRNRLRARMYFQHFLGIDVMQLAPRVNDAAAITAKYEVPTMEASDCVVCHRIVDPVAGIFQDYYKVDGSGIYGPRKDGWFEDMFGAGFEGEDLPTNERWRAIQWLGERTAKDPRFAVAMVEHVWYVLTGRTALRAPEDSEDPLFTATHRAWIAQRDKFAEIARKFAADDFNLKTAIKELAASNFYRGDGLAGAIADPNREAELHDIGLARMLSPEQLDRKIAAIFGEPWGKLGAHFKILYGGIDSKAVTERIADPSGGMGAIQRIMANDVACKFTGRDFTLEPADRSLFPKMEPGILPGSNDENDRKIREAIVFLHQQLLGRFDAIDHPEVDRTFGLFAGVLADANAKDRFEPLESYFCGGGDAGRMPDPDYSIRAWRAVVAYLLRQQEFLYE